MNRRNWLKYLSVSGVAGIMPWSFLPKEETPSITEALTNECLTTDDILGPFYIPDTIVSNQIAPADAPGTPLVISGTVYARDCQSPLPNAKVEVWQASDDGDYFNDSYRATLLTDAAGNYTFTTILPGKYLNGNQFRPRHLHYKVSSGAVELVTQIYFSGDTSIPTDPWASDPDAAERIIDLNMDANQNLHGVADIYLDVEPVSNQDEPRGRQGRRLGLIKGISPQPVPIGSEAIIHFLTALRGQVQIDCFDLNGRQVSRPLSSQEFAPGSHQVPFHILDQLGIKMPSGIYILRLSFNQQTVDAKRIMVA